jgi:cell division protein FtsI (penicillin-binding protein 3)
VFGVLTARVAQLQLMSGDRYTNLATEQSLKTIPINAERGSVFDRNGSDLALSIRRSTVYADPTLVTDPLGTAAKLAPILKVDQNSLLKPLSAKPSRFAYIAHTVDDATVDAIDALHLPGIGFTPESARSYPAGTLAGALMGHVGTDGKGLDGIEYLYNNLLTGTPGELSVEQDPRGTAIPNTTKTRVEAKRGTDVVLTIDQDTQWETENALLDQVRATQAKGGMAAIVDVTTGDVLSMATVEGASAAKPAHVAGAGEHNSPLTELFAPGSTTKLITLSWAIEHGLITPTTKFNVPASIKVDPSQQAPFVDAEWHAPENWTTADILRESSNVGTIKIAQKMKNQELYDGVRAFGLGTKTAIAWPGQPNGLVLPASQYYSTGKYSTAIGYGAAVTGMQMLDAFTTIANDGVSRPPRLLSATIDAKGVRHPAATPSGTRVVSSTTAHTMTSMLEGVVGNGTGACAAIPGYPVAGKTGTSKKLLDSGKYSDSSTMASFIGYAPADHPRFAAMVVLDDPAPQYQFGGASAAPVWSEIMQFALTRYVVPPTDATNAQFKQAKAAAQYPCSVPHGNALNQVLAQQAQAAQQQQHQSQTGTTGAAGSTGSNGGATVTTVPGAGESGGTATKVRTDSSPSN